MRLVDGLGRRPRVMEGRTQRTSRCSDGPAKECALPYGSESTCAAMLVELNRADFADMPADAESS